MCFFPTSVKPSPLDREGKKKKILNLSCKLTAAHFCRIDLFAELIAFATFDKFCQISCFLFRHQTNTSPGIEILPLMGNCDVISAF